MKEGFPGGKVAHRSCAGLTGCAVPGLRALARIPSGTRHRCVEARPVHARVAAPGVTKQLSVWTFARTHYDAYREVIPQFEQTHPGVKADLQQVHGRAVTQRLQAAFWADLDVPDLVETEISFVGTFFRGRLDEVGFLDLTERYHQSGLYDRVVKTRLSPWSSRGRIFGIPHDVHPVMLAYRRDIFEQEGIDASTLDTWDKFVEAGRRMTRDLDGDGTIDRYMIELSFMDAGSLETLLFQRDGGFFDADGNLVMDNGIAIETMRWYVTLIAGPNRISGFRDTEFFKLKIYALHETRFEWVGGLIN